MALELKEYDGAKEKIIKEKDKKPEKKETNENVEINKEEENKKEE